MEQNIFADLFKSTPGVSDNVKNDETVLKEPIQNDSNEKVNPLLEEKKETKKKIEEISTEMVEIKEDVKKEKTIPETEISNNNDFEVRETLSEKKVSDKAENKDVVKSQINNLSDFPERDIVKLEDMMITVLYEPIIMPNYFNYPEGDNRLLSGKYNVFYCTNDTIVTKEGTEKVESVMKHAGFVSRNYQAIAMKPLIDRFIELGGNVQGHFISNMIHYITLMMKPIDIKIDDVVKLVYGYDSKDIEVKYGIDVMNSYNGFSKMAYYPFITINHKTLDVKPIKVMLVNKVFKTRHYNTVESIDVNVDIIEQSIFTSMKYLLETKMDSQTFGKVFKSLNATNKKLYESVLSYLADNGQQNLLAIMFHIDTFVAKQKKVSYELIAGIHKKLLQFAK